MKESPGCASNGTLRHGSRGSSKSVEAIDMDGAVNPQLFPGNKSAGTSLNLTRRGYSPANDGELDSRRRSKEATPRGIARCKFTLTSVAIGSTIWALKALLCSIDVVLTVSQPLLAMLATCFRALRRSKKQPPNVERARVVVIGASFAGLEAIHHLKARSDIDVVLVTDRPYFEYTPGILRCLVQPEHFHALACPLPSMSTHTIIGTAKSVASDQVKVVTAPDTHELVPFTHCLITVGNAYSEPMIKPSAELESTLLQRAATWKRANAELLIASSVLVVGGGLVGVELAAEIAVALPHIAVTLVHSHTELCNELPASARAYVRRWLKTRGVDLRLGRRVTKMEPQHCLLDDGSLVTFSLVYRCTGGRGQSNLEGCGSEALGTQRKGTGYYLRTNENLEVVGRRAVWAAGDSMMMQTEMDGGVRDGGGGTRAGREVKNAHTAEQTAKLAAWNILRSLEGHTRAVPEVRAATQAARAMKDKVLATGAEAEGARLASIQDKAVAGVDAADNGAGRASSLKDVQGRRGNAPRGAGAGGESGRDGLLRYPEGLAGEGHIIPHIYCVSLGPYDGVLAFNWFVLPGPVAAIFKWLVEWTKVASVQGRPIGRVFWQVADASSLLISNTLIRPDLESPALEPPDLRVSEVQAQSDDVVGWMIESPTRPVDRSPLPRRTQL